MLPRFFPKDSPTFRLQPRLLCWALLPAAAGRGKFGAGPKQATGAAPSAQMPKVDRHMEATMPDGDEKDSDVPLVERRRFLFWFGMAWESGGLLVAVFSFWFLWGRFLVWIGRVLGGFGFGEGFWWKFFFG